MKIFRRAWRGLARLDVAALLIAVVLLLVALGSCFPLEPAVGAGSAEWQEAIQARYGGLAGVLTSLRLFNWFTSPVFLLALAGLLLATLACTLNRWPAVWRRAVAAPPVTVDALEAAPYQARLAGPSPQILAGYLSGDGFRVRIETVDGCVHLRGDRYRLAALASLVTHLAVLFLLLGTGLSQMYAWQELLVIPSGETVSLAHTPTLALRNDGFTIARYADGSAAGYSAVLTVLAGGQAAGRGLVELNRPLPWQGASIYLQGYQGDAGVATLTLLARYDPGYGPVIAAGFLLLVGLTLSLYFPRAWVQARFEPNGTVALAGWAERRARNFAGDFARLVAALERAGQRDESVC